MKKKKKLVPNCVPEEDQKDESPANASKRMIKVMLHYHLQ